MLFPPARRRLLREDARTESEGEPENDTDERRAEGE
jgi:hypothetical protein